MDSEQDKILTVSETAKFLRISKAQVYSMIARKEIPHIRVTEKRVIVPMKELKEWLNKRLVMK